MQRVATAERRWLEVGGLDPVWRTFEPPPGGGGSKADGRRCEGGFGGPAPARGINLSSPGKLQTSPPGFFPVGSIRGDAGGGRRRQRVRAASGGGRLRP